MRDGIITGLGIFAGILIATYSQTLIGGIAIAIPSGIAIAIIMQLGDYLHDRYPFKTDIRG
jgi:hypothetical protein